MTPDVGSLRAALERWVARTGGWYGSPTMTAEEAYATAIEEVAAMLHDPSLAEPVTPAPSEREAGDDHDHHFDKRCPACLYLAGSPEAQIDVAWLAEALHETEWLCNHGHHSSSERPPADDHDRIDAERLLETYARLAAATPEKE